MEYENEQNVIQELQDRFVTKQHQQQSQMETEVSLNSQQNINDYNEINETNIIPSKQIEQLPEQDQYIQQVYHDSYLQDNNNSISNENNNYNNYNNDDNDSDDLFAYESQNSNENSIGNFQLFTGLNTIGLIFFACGYFPSLRSDNEECVSLSYWAYAQSGFILIFSIYLVFYSNIEKKIENYKKNNYEKSFKTIAFYLIYEEIGVKFFLGCSFIIALGFSATYFEHQSCQLLTALTGIYSLIYWFMFSIILNGYCRYVCEDSSNILDPYTLNAQI